MSSRGTHYSIEFMELFEEAEKILSEGPEPNGSSEMARPLLPRTWQSEFHQTWRDHAGVLDMNCQHCGRTVKMKLQDYPYTERGLKHIILAKAPVYACPRHGVQGLAAEKVDGLEGNIAEAILQRREPLAGAELRFFRKYHGWNQTQLADLLGVTRVTVSNWERQAAPIGAANQERLYLLLTNPQTFRDVRLHPKERRNGRRALRVPMPRSRKRAASTPVAA